MLYKAIQLVPEVLDRYKDHPSVRVDTRRKVSEIQLPVGVGGKIKYPIGINGQKGDIRLKFKAYAWTRGGYSYVQVVAALGGKRLQPLFVNGAAYFSYNAAVVVQTRTNGRSLQFRVAQVTLSPQKDHVYVKWIIPFTEICGSDICLSSLLALVKVSELNKSVNSAFEWLVKWHCDKDNAARFFLSKEDVKIKKRQAKTEAKTT